MNTKQKLLTAAALIVFIVIGALHYAQEPYRPPHGINVIGAPPTQAILSDVKTPWFMLGVIYAGLFFLLKDRRGS